MAAVGHIHVPPAPDPAHSSAVERLAATSEQRPQKQARTCHVSRCFRDRNINNKPMNAKALLCSTIQPSLDLALLSRPAGQHPSILPVWFRSWYAAPARFKQEQLQLLPDELSSSCNPTLICHTNSKTKLWKTLWNAILLKNAKPRLCV